MPIVPRSTDFFLSCLVREADVTHVSRAILDAAAEFDARLIVVNSPRHRIPVGGVAEYLVHHAEVPIAVAPKPCWRRWCVQWGATAAEASHALPGDELQAGRVLRRGCEA